MDGSATMPSRKFSDLEIRLVYYGGGGRTDMEVYEWMLNRGSKTNSATSKSALHNIGGENGTDTEV